MIKNTFIKSDFFFVKAIRMIELDTVSLIQHLLDKYKKSFLHKQIVWIVFDECFLNDTPVLATLFFQGFGSRFFWKASLIIHYKTDLT